MRKHRIVILFMMLAPLAFAETKTIEIAAQKSFYSPDHIRVKKGEPLKLLVHSSDVTHGFAIDEFDIAREVPAGPPVAIEFTPDRTGVFTFYCVVRCGRDHKRMRGTLTVED